MKFEEAYCPSTGKTYGIETLVDIFEKSPTIFSLTYKEHLYCPECHQAHLMYNNGKTPYFSSYPKSSHELGCSLQQNIMPPKQSAGFVSDNSNNTKIQRQIQSVMVRLLATEQALSAKQTNYIAQEKTSAIASLKTDNKQSHRLQQKRIDFPFHPDDFGCYKLFYGKVWLQWEWHEKNEAYVLLMRHSTKKQMVCCLKVTLLAYKYISKNYKFNGTHVGSVVFLANIEARNKHYQFATLERGEYLSIVADDIV